MMTKEDRLRALTMRIEEHPELLERFEAILDIAENSSGELITADQAEGKVIEEIDVLAKELLKEWAVGQQKKSIRNS